MKQGKVDLRQAALKSCLHAAVILTGILAGAVTAHDAAENEKLAMASAAPLREGAGSAPTAARAGVVVLDAEAMRLAARLGHAAVGLDGARTSTDAMLSATAVDETCTMARHARVYALVDPMLVPEARTVVSALAQAEKGAGGLISLNFSGTGAAEPGANEVNGVGQMLPWLIELPAEPGRDALARLTMGWARDRHGAVWVVSGCPVEVLASLLGRAMQARWVDGHPVLLRLADARVLDMLQEVLDPDQQQDLWSHAAQWRHLDRRGNLQHTEASVSPIQGHARQPLVLNDDQIDRLLRAAEPDEALPGDGQQH
jgi:hypothetical protein